MTTATTATLEEMRQHFDQAPFPRIPLEHFPNDPNRLYIHSLVTANYRCHGKVIDPAGKVILDAGCGTGYKSMELSVANPGAKIIGIDLSAASIELARQRLKFHNLDHQVEFYAMPIEDLPSLGLKFDYINTDEVLYLVPDPVAALTALQAVLNPGGIMRVNFHSALQRSIFFCVQKFFRELGLMAGAPQDSEIALVRQTMNNLKDAVFVKSNSWLPIFADDDERILANYLLKGDKGWTIPEFFAALQAANLEFISMVNWWQWDLVDLFKSIDELPIEIAMNLSDKSPAEQLHLFELLHPTNRLLDLWCGLPGESLPITPTEDWTTADWQATQVHLHPQLRTPAFKQDLLTCISELKMFDICRHLKINIDGPLLIDSSAASCLLQLFTSPQPIAALVQHWQTLRPLDPLTLEPTQAAPTFELIRQMLMPLETYGYILFELPNI
jgi:2-polyprenyl-3-methyl-5-hydroxy-6-metoxy-1,4-benzoquinol methylase